MTCAEVKEYNGELTIFVNDKPISAEDVQKEIGYEVIKSIVKGKYIKTDTGVGNPIGEYPNHVLQRLTVIFEFRSGGFRSRNQGQPRFLQPAW